MLFSFPNVMKVSRTFYKLALSTLVAVYILIIVGGVVRSTGSGMGCPDWPKCFGQWVPPTSVTQLPEDYKEQYAEYRHKKNIKFAGYLDALGFDETADRILNDESIRVEADFNPVKTWIEYFNRIVGVIIGLLIFAVMVYALRYRKTHRTLTILSIATFLLVGFQGWIGSFVVSTNLTPWTITVHMFLALVIVLMLVYLVHQAGNFNATNWREKVAPPLVIFCIVLMFAQILLGTQVREMIDLANASGAARENWISEAGLRFIVHRSFSWAVLIAHVFLVLKLRQTEGGNVFALSVILLILGTILTGIGMAWFAIPAFLQPVHLVLATVTLGLEYMLLLRINTKQTVAFSNKL